MNTPVPGGDWVSRTRRFERVCDRFERDCRRGPARPEDYLGEVAEADRAALLRELLELLAYHHDQLNRRGRRDARRRPGAREGIAAAASGRLRGAGGTGRGGMGVVYKARHLVLNRVVALKMILAGAHAGPHQLARFRTEAEAAARLQHPNVVAIHEVGEVDGMPYLALEFVDGGTLEKKLGGTPLPCGEAARLVQTLAARGAARPRARRRPPRPQAANVLLCADGSPKVADFGLAKWLADDLTGPTRPTHTGAVLGTPATWPRTGRRRGEDRRPGGGHLCAGRHPLRVPHRPAAVQGGDPPGNPAPGDDRGTRRADAPPAEGAARSGDDLPEVPAQGAAQTLRQRRRPGRRPGPLPGGQADHRPAPPAPPSA